MKTGLDFSKISDIVYWSKTKEAMILSGICMLKAKFLQRDKIVWSIVHKKDFKTTRSKDENADAFANDMLSIKGVEVAVFFREKSEKTLRVSLRSKGKINVAGIAEKFKGGGHFDMAGCFVSNNQKAIRKVLDEAKKALNQ